MGRSNDEAEDLFVSQLFVALKMNKLNNQLLPMDLLFYVVGSLIIIGNWNKMKVVVCFSRHGMFVR